LLQYCRGSLARACDELGIRVPPGNLVHITDRQLRCFLFFVGAMGPFVDVDGLGEFGFAMAPLTRFFCGGRTRKRLQRDRTAFCFCC